MIRWLLTSQRLDVTNGKNLGLWTQQPFEFLENQVSIFVDGCNSQLRALFFTKKLPGYDIRMVKEACGTKLLVDGGDVSTAFLLSIQRVFAVPLRAASASSSCLSALVVKSWNPKSKLCWRIVCFRATSSRAAQPSFRLRPTDSADADSHWRRADCCRNSR